MKNTTLAFCAVAVLSMTACDTMYRTEPTTLPAGQYTHSESTTTPSGTQVDKTTNTNVYYDQNGNKRAVQQTDTTRDPPGLMNKSTSSTTKTY